MKKNYLILGIAIMCIWAFTACNEKNTNANQATADESETTVETEESNREERADTAIAEVADDTSADDAEEYNWENEVWTTFGGTYFFFGDGLQFAVEFPLGEDVIKNATLYVGDEELEADVDAKTGLITACDDDGKEVFRGAIYAGGNLLKGTYRGKHIEVWGSGD